MVYYSNFQAGFPVKGGLYDPRMGADEEDSQICDTCGLGYHNCPGHFGHIELTVPVFNPLMYKLTQNVRKIFKKALKIF